MFVEIVVKFYFFGDFSYEYDFDGDVWVVFRVDLEVWPF